MDKNKIKKKLKKQKEKKHSNNKFDIVSCGGVVFYINEDKPKYLLLKHSGGKKHWDLPKGHLEKGETIEDCALREVVEETGIPIKKLKIIKKLEHESIYIKERKFRKNKVKIVYLFLFQAHTEKIKLSREHTNYKWLKFSKIKEKLTFSTSYPAFIESYEIIKKLAN